MQAYIERFEGTSVLTDNREIATADDAAAALDQLDGREVTSITYERGEGANLMVSGGPGAYLASLWDDEAGEGWVAEAKGPGETGEVEVVSAGQSVLVPANQVLSRGRVAEIVTAYVADGSRTAAVDWAAN